MFDFMMLPQIEIIIFDFWQTLADSELKPSDLFNVLMLHQKMDFKSFVKILSCSDIFLKNIAIEDSIKILLSDLNIKKDEFLIEKTTLLWKEMAKKAFIMNGAKELLLNLKHRGYTLCLLTNIDKYGYEYFPDSEIFDFFDYQLLSYSTGIAKPSATCWKTIKNNYKIGFERMMMVGDSYGNDILPAKRLGVCTAQIKSDTSLSSDIMFHPFLGR